MGISEEGWLKLLREERRKSSIKSDMIKELWFALSDQGADFGLWVEQWNEEGHEDWVEMLAKLLRI